MSKRNRGHSNGNESGNSYDRRRRRLWLVSPEAGFGGDGSKVLCQVCQQVWVTVENMFVGRIIPRHKGGRYVRGNVRPECSGCSCAEGGQVSQAMKAAKRAGMEFA